MEILKTATDWAKAEAFSSAFFIAFAILFLLASLGFWQLGKSEIARAYVIPTLLAGALLIIIGIGLVYANQTRIAEWPGVYNDDPAAFIAAELVRVDGVLAEYKTIVFTAIPIIIAACAALIYFLDTPIWRSSLITTIAMLTVILLIDGTAQSRIAAYKEQLLAAQAKS